MSMPFDPARLLLSRCCCASLRTAWLRASLRNRHQRRECMAPPTLVARLTLFFLACSTVSTQPDVAGTDGGLGGGTIVGGARVVHLGRFSLGVLSAQHIEPGATVMMDDGREGNGWGGAGLSLFVGIAFHHGRLSDRHAESGESHSFSQRFKPQYSDDTMKTAVPCSWRQTSHK